jgi:hypothetical protein
MNNVLGGNTTTASVLMDAGEVLSTPEDIDDSAEWKWFGKNPIGRSGKWSTVNLFLIPVVWIYRF